MDTNTRTRIARTAAFAVAASITAVTTTVAAAPAPARPAPEPERPCFIVQPRWNTAVDGPAPTCATPAWQEAGTGRGEAPDVATIADCVDPTHRPVVKTCPYPIKSGDRFTHYFETKDIVVEDGRVRIRP
jgi:hypothetical protein